MRRFVTVVAAAAVLALTGCGDDDDGGGGSGGGGSSGSSSGGGAAAGEEQAVRATIEDYIGALIADDPKAACALQTEEAQRAAAEEVPGASTCERAHEIILGALGPKVNELEGALTKSLSEVEVSGDTAKLTSPKEPGKELKLRRVGGDWKVDDKVLTYTPN